MPRGSFRDDAQLCSNSHLRERPRFTAFESLRSDSIGFSLRRTTGPNNRRPKVKAISHLVKHERQFFCERRDVSGLALALCHACSPVAPLTPFATGESQSLNFYSPWLLTFTGLSSLKETCLLSRPEAMTAILRRLRLSAPITSSHRSWLLHVRQTSQSHSAVKWYYTLKTKVAAATLFLKMWYSCEAGSAISDLPLVTAMSSSDGANDSSDAARRRRRRSNTLLLVLAVKFLIFGAAAGALYYALQPVTLRIAVGPLGSNDHKVIVAAAGAFVSESRTVRLSLITTDGAVEALALLGAGKADLAVARGDLEMPADAQTVAIVRKNVVVLWAPSGLADKSSKRKPAPKVQQIADLAGHRVGVIGLTPANVALLRVILSASGVEADKVGETQLA